jgi:hypothetical protein
MTADKCKWCGEPEKNVSLSATRYLCNTQYLRGIGTWVRGGQCERDGLRKRIEAATQRLESLNGRHVGVAELYAVIEILEGKG